ncbi:MAG TPA: STAS domain-containing protein [Chryseosolibacter sp.]
MNSNSLTIFADHQTTIIKQWSDSQTDSYLFDGSLPQARHTECRDMYDCLFNDLLVGNSIGTPKGKITSTEEAIDHLALSWLKKGYTPRDVTSFFLTLKQVLLDTLQRYTRDQNELIEESLKVQKLVDRLVILCVESFVKNRETIILRQLDELNDISTPVIKIWDGILGLPIVGTLDSSRMETVLEAVLESIANGKYHIVIVDISGVPAVDSTVADHLLKLAKAIRLMGGECIISGIIPAIAQTVVNLGIDLSSVNTKATLASALREAFKVLDLQVTKVNKRTSYYNN